MIIQQNELRQLHQNFIYFDLNEHSEQFRLLRVIWHMKSFSVDLTFHLL